MGIGEGRPLSRSGSSSNTSAGKATAEISDDANVQSLAVYFVAITRGMELLGRAGVGRSILSAVALDALRVLDATASGVAEALRPQDCGTGQRAHGERPAHHA